MIRPLLFTLISIVFFACGSDTSGESQEAGMEQFSEDQEFKDSHEEPKEIEFEGIGEMFEFNTSDGNTGKAYRLMPEEPANRFLFVIHEWWGLNDYVKMESERLFKELDNTIVLALDMYDGKVATTRDEAGEYMQSVTEERANAIIDGALAYAGKDGQVATIGWCFGGGWSLRTSIAAADRGAGCVMYYGMPVENAANLEPLEADILGIFATEDEWINRDVVNKFEALCAATGKDLNVNWYSADHAFANPSQPSYNEEAAQKANAKALAFLKSHLGIE
ncbi:MAG: dienelactone hydrolase family protein [Bacteroidetes bacterium]|nr:dienelactone hydrolase family protein [Bacteroidota bacterium]